MRKLLNFLLMQQKPTQFYFWSFLLAFISSFILFTLPGDDLPSVHWFNFPYFDKLVHAAIFISLCFTCFWWIKVWRKPQKWRLAAMLIALLLLMYGIGIEFYQDLLVKSRAFELADIVADGFGCLSFLGILFTKYPKTPSM